LVSAEKNRKARVSTVSYMIKKWLVAKGLGLLFLGLATINSYSQTVEDHVKAGDTHFKEGDYQKGIVEYKKAIEINPEHNDVSIYYNLGAAYGFLGQHEKALNYFEKARKMSPDDAGIYYNLAIGHASLEQHEDAKENFLKARELFLKKGDDKNALKVEEYLSKIPATEVSEEAAESADSGELQGPAVDKETVELIAGDMAKDKKLGKELTEAEIELLSDYPERGARLKEIADYATAAAKNAHEADQTVPEDAYRHVLWSYLLTKEYDTEFAKKVTDAHEIGDTKNTEEDHIMDYNNNEVGRRYAEEEYEESEVLEKVMSDEGVMR